MIKQIQIAGFKSLNDVTVDLAPITALIGKSGVGKSNFMDAVKFLRDLLLVRNADQVVQQLGGWPRIITISSAYKRLQFRVRFGVDGFPDDFEYSVGFMGNQNHPAHLLFSYESLKVGENVLFAQESGKWQIPPGVALPPSPGTVLLGGITGLQEATIAYNTLAFGLGCYRIGDSVIQVGAPQPNGPQNGGLNDSAGNFIAVVADINRDVRHWRDMPNIAVALRGLKPSLDSITIDQPQNQNLMTAHRIPDLPLVTFDIAQESEGFRRLFACLLALYQLPSKPTVLFDEPEKGIYPAGLTILADEFKRFASKRGGQVIFTTHSPEFLDYFEPESMRIVEMKNYHTQIGLLAPEQRDSVKEQLLKPGELLTVDPARLATTATSAS